jgi:translation initiation factor 2 gamma subunit (eIF-2gamma)
MEIQNPYLQQKRDLIVAIDKAKTERKPVEEIMQLQNQLEEVTAQERLMFQEVLVTTKQKVEVIAKQMERVKLDYPSKAQQYKEAIRLYREIMGYMENGKLIKEGLVQQIRTLKHELR